MRAQLLLALALVAAGSLAGCVGGEKETGVKDIDTGDPDGEKIDLTKLPQLKVLAPLAATIGTDAPAWIQSGTEVPVTLSTVANAKGAVSHTWAVGPLPGTVDVAAAKADTGSKGSDYIQPGASKSITYAVSGVYAMHCHPHAWMRHNVTVVDGYAGPKAVEVVIVDGEKPTDMRFIPENIVVGMGTTVTYKNLGAQPHTATAMGAQEPPLKKVPLTAATGSVKVEGNGWMRIVAIFQDTEGRFGYANRSIYATPELPAYEKTTHEFSFDAALPVLAGTPAAPASESAPVSLEHPGVVFLNYTFQDAASGAGAPENLAEVEIHFTKDGETQDTLTGGPDATNALTGKALAGAYTLKVVPVQGAQVSGTVTIEVLYDLVPPPVGAAPPPADDGHGGHAH